MARLTFRDAGKRPREGLRSLPLVSGIAMTGVGQGEFHSPPLTPTAHDPSSVSLSFAPFRVSAPTLMNVAPVDGVLSVPPSVPLSMLQKALAPVPSTSFAQGTEPPTSAVTGASGVMTKVADDDNAAFLSFLNEAASSRSDQAPAELDALGGDQGVGRTVVMPNDLLRAVEAGFRAAALDALIAAGINQAELETLVAPLRTLQRRKRDGRLTPAESDAALRVARILSHAEMTLGSRERALAWLRRPNRTFGDATPMALLATEAGGRRIEDQLLRADYGQMA